ncbi:MAG: MotA/TolQ/ExbB proton channel family protein [Erythrobacter sp.]
MAEFWGFWERRDRYAANACRHHGSALQPSWFPNDYPVLESALKRVSGKPSLRLNRFQSLNRLQDHGPHPRTPPTVTNDFALLFDPDALALVLLGTLLATFARSGWRDVRQTLRALAGLSSDPFDQDANQSAVAQTIRAVQRDGPLRAKVPAPPDPAMAELIDTYIRSRSLAALHSAQRTARAKRDIKRMQATRTFEHAGELAPVFGLVGTLFAITQLAPGDAGVLENTMGSIAAAAVSTLYGVLSAHMVFIPLGRAIERHSEREEYMRDRLIDWLGAQLDQDSSPHDIHLRGAA